MNFEEPDNIPKQENIENSLPEGFNDKLENLKFQKEKLPRQYFSVINELKSMSEGKDIEGIREEFYKGWNDGDFKKLLEALNEK